MVNGLSMSEEAFTSLPTSDQRLVLFQNLRELRSEVKKYKFHQKIQYYWVLGLTAVGAFYGTLLFTLKGG